MSCYDIPNFPNMSNHRTFYPKHISGWCSDSTSQKMQSLEDSSNCISFLEPRDSQPPPQRVSKPPF